ncbi:MAG: cell division protein FtsQ/DivIB, partial [Chloroflexota bacterium]
MAVRGAKKQRQTARSYRTRAERGGGAGKAADRPISRYRLACLALVAVFVLVIYQMLNADAFRVAKVEVQGNSLLSRQEIVDALGLMGRSAFSVDKRAAEGKVLALAPAAEADV